MNPLVRLIGVSKRYAGASALQPTNLTVVHGKRDFDPESLKASE